MLPLSLYRCAVIRLIMASRLSLRLHLQHQHNSNKNTMRHGALKVSQTNLRKMGRVLGEGYRPRNEARASTGLDSATLCSLLELYGSIQLRISTAVGWKITNSQEAMPYLLNLGQVRHVEECQYPEKQFIWQAEDVAWYLPRLSQKRFNGLRRGSSHLASYCPVEMK